jgi:hypothetical protein
MDGSFTLLDTGIMTGPSIASVNVSNDGVPTGADEASNVQVSFGDFTYYMLTVLTDSDGCILHL